MNEDGNVIGRVGALAVIVFAVWGVTRINAGKFRMCPVEKATLSCCTGEAEPDAAAAATPAPAATPAKH